MIAKTIAPDVIVLPELALCSYMGSTDIWQYADIDSDHIVKMLASGIITNCNRNISQRRMNSMRKISPLEYKSLPFTFSIELDEEKQMKLIIDFLCRMLQIPKEIFI